MSSTRLSLSTLALLAGPFALTGGTMACTTSSDASAQSDNPITVIDQTAVKRQSIGNCWLYATASWAESLAKTSGSELNMSESYWTYWHWFEQIVGGFNDEIQTGGSFWTASDLIAKYGVVSEGAFIPAEEELEMSARQKTALAIINESLKNGTLSTVEARQDRALVKRELDAAWQLTESVRTNLSQVFGDGVTRNLANAPESAQGFIRAARDVVVVTPDPSTHEMRTAKLGELIFGSRSPLAWRSAFYPDDASGRRQFQKRVQRAMHDHAPVVVSWFVDFNALDATGRFVARPETPGRQGGHMTVFDDYEVENVPGFGTLKAGVDATREQMDAALSDQAKIVFFRVKNSWGSSRPDRQFVVPGYHDLYMTYLNGPVPRCAERSDGTTDPTSCFDDVPLSNVVLPAGY